MKKIMITLGIMSLSATISFASIEADKSSDIELLRSQGYSESALRVVDTVKAHNQGEKYKRHFIKQEKTKYQNVKAYWDPFQDDDSFGEHQIEFTNNWMGDDPHYSTTKKYVKPVENL